MEIRSLSSVYTVRRLVPTDVEQVFVLCAGDPTFYRHHPPFVTRESILEDLEVLPPGKERRDKLFVGFFAEDGLIAVMDPILGYPGDGAAGDLSGYGWASTRATPRARPFGQKIALSGQGSGIRTTFPPVCPWSVRCSGHRRGRRHDPSGLYAGGTPAGPGGPRGGGRAGGLRGGLRR